MMGTRCLIGILEKDRTVECIYCHWDGYPDYVGKILNEYYCSKEQIEQLLALGDISSLGRYIAPQAGIEHSFEHPQKDVTVAYYRDRGETKRKSAHFACVRDFLNYYDDSWCQYAYLYDVLDGFWYYADGVVSDEDDFCRLSQAVVTEESSC